MPLILKVMKTEMNRLNQYKLVTAYIIANFSHYCEEFGDVMVKSNIVEDIAKMNYIIGRMENYLTDKMDVENFQLMEDWFKREMEERDYVYSDFTLYIVNNHIEEEDERDSD